MNEHPIAAVKLSLRLSAAPGHFLSICGGPRVDLWGLRAVYEKITEQIETNIFFSIFFSIWGSMGAVWGVPGAAQE